MAAALDTPHALDTHLRVCANTLTATARTVPDGIATVPAAVLHLAERQAQGWSYLRA